MILSDFLLTQPNFFFLASLVTKHIPYSLLSIMADLFFFKMSTDSDGTPIYCLVKLRFVLSLASENTETARSNLFPRLSHSPGLLTFLKAASRLFEIYLCTFGTATYAREVRHKLVELTTPTTLNQVLISREQLLRPGDKRTHHLGFFLPLRPRKTYNPILNFCLQNIVRILIQLFKLLEMACIHRMLF